MRTKKQIHHKALLKALSDLCKTIKFTLLTLFVLSMIFDVQLNHTFPLVEFELVIAAAFALMM